MGRVLPSIALERQARGTPRNGHSAPSTPTRASSSFTICFGRARTMRAKLMEPLF